jgi:hypothetical protein
VPVTGIFVANNWDFFMFNSEFFFIQLDVFLHSVISGYIVSLLI